jgi:hypothetical protein
VKRRRGKRRKKLLDDLKDRRGYSHLKEESLDGTMRANVLEETLDLSSDRLLTECAKKPSLKWIYLLKTGQAFIINVFLILKSHVTTILITEILPSKYA